MSTLEFFKAILPAEGTYFLAIFKPGSKAPAHKAFTSLEDMAHAVAELEQKNPTWTTYHACSSYKDKSVDVGGKKKYRVSENWDKAKAFWCDIDCGQDKADEGKGYATKRLAAEALVGFCKQTGFPAPMFVDSGNGVHCYWPLTKAIPSATWQRMAFAIKALFDHHGLLVDPSRTADFASILRPVGSFHKKGEPKEVVCKKTTDLIDPSEFAEKIKSLVQDIKVEKPVQKFDADNDDLLAHAPVSMPTSAIEIAKKCNQVAEMRDMRGDVSYEQWRGVMGIIKHCTEGSELAHEWSAGHPNYTYEDTQYKFDSWNTKPSTCEFFSKCNPKGCEGCSHKGKITTPMVLGRVVEQQKELVVEAQVDGKTMEFQIPEFPKDFKFENGQMVRYMQDKDEIWHAFSFSPNLFYPIHRVRKEDGTFCLIMRLHLPDNRTREFTIDTNLLASTQKLLDGLGEYELFPLTTKDAPNHMTAYLRHYLEKLKGEAEELNTMTNFGWREDLQSFLIGDRLYHRDGTIRKVLIGGYAKDKESSFPPPRGTANGYAKALNFLYNKPGLEYRQYAIASGFGSILTPFGDSLYKGLLFALTGANTSKGKTTLCRAVLYAFGNADKMTIKTEKGATLNARNARMGTYNNIPFLFDELTNIDAEEFSQLAYTVSLGEEKDRLTVSRGNNGTRMATSGSWAMCPFLTANTDLHSILATRGDTQAEAVRLIQIRMDQYQMSDLKGSEITAAMKQIELNMGAAGEEFVKYVVTHIEDVLELMAKWGKRIEKDIPDLKYRLYRAHAVCSMTAMEITNKLNITEFNLERLYEFAIGLFHDLAEIVSERNTITPEEGLNRMVTDLSPRVITTVEYRDARDGRGPEDIRYSSSHAPVGRYITGNSNTKDNPLAGKLFLCRKEVLDWCDLQRVDFKNMMSYAHQAGFVVEWKEKFTIGRGTKVATGNTRCIVLDYEKMQSGSSSVPKLTVHTLKPVQSNDTAVNN